MQRLRIFLYVCVLLTSSLLPYTAAAQRTEGNAPAESDSIQLFRGFAVSYNIAGTVMRIASDYGEIEAAVKANFRDKYFPIIELGLGTAKHDADAVTGIAAKTNSPFFRLGCDFNVSKNKHDAYRVLFGARYGFTAFKQEAYGDIVDPYWGEHLYYSSETNCTYHWAEILLALDAKLWGPVRLGWSFRYKRPLSSSNDNPQQNIWYIPGFGKRGNKLGGTFNVTIELWRKNKKI